MLTHLAMTTVAIQLVKKGAVGYVTYVLDSSKNTGSSLLTKQNKI